MNNVYVAPVALLVDDDGMRAKTAPRSRQHHWHLIPGTVRALVVIDFADDPARTDFENLPGVVALQDVMQLSAMGPVALTNLAPLGAQAGDSVLTFLQRLRADWPMARPWFD